MPTPLIERYRRYLPVNDDTPVISLFEGDTPLIRLTNIMHDEFADKITVYAKFDGMNPTGSFKDRGMTMAVSKAAETGSRAVVCASTGNTSASAAAYAARAGMQAFVLIPQGKVALGKLAQAMMFGARVVQIDGNFDDGMQLVKQLSDALPLTLVNSVNPYRLHGQKTAAFEIVDTLGVAPDYHFLPVGNAGNISAYWMGYNEYHDDGIIDRKPVMVGYQASGAAPLVHGAPVQQPETVATAIRIGNPQSWQLAVTAAEESNGWFAALDDDDILSAQRLLAARDGVFCEPASAIALAGLRHEFARGVIPAGATVVCTLTGNGMKDPDTAIKQCGNDALLQCAAEESAISALVTPYLRRH